MHHHRHAAAALGALLALAAPAAAFGASYPPPADPGHGQKAPKGPFHTITVCAKHGKKARGCAKAIQAAIGRAHAGDSVKVPAGVYREHLKINGSSKRYIKLVGDPKHPGKVVIDGKGSSGNGVTINGADHVTVNGFTARNYGGYGFFAVNVDGYELTNLRAILTGIYGVYAFNSKGGEISHSSASWNNDGGFYIGQTPPQSKPERSLVTDVSSYDNVIGFSGTNMRYVTITKSKFFNNGVGIVPNALDSEKFAPPEDNVITDNDIFWNNFDYYHAAPFKRRAGATGDFTYPVGVGVVIFGGRRNRVENNRLYGNYLSGVLEVQQILLKQKDAQELVGNTVTNNQFGQGGADRNGRDLTYDGDGSGNCFAGNSGVATTEPADPAVFAPCGPDGTFSGANAFSAPTQTVVANWTLDADHETYWVKYPHAAKAGYTPLERYVKGQTPMVQPSR